MTDAIRVRRLVVDMHVGVPEEERKTPQAVWFDLEIHRSLAAAGRNDDLRDTLDYSVITARVAEVAQNLEAHLLEHVAQRVADVLLEMPEVASVTVEVGKRNPPVDEEVEAISVLISRP